MTLPAKEKDTVKEAVQKLKEKRMRQDALKQIRDRVAHRKAPQAAASRGSPRPARPLRRRHPRPARPQVQGLLRPDLERVQSAWILPEAISRQNRKLETIVAIRIQRNGQIVKTWVENRGTGPTTSPLCGPSPRQTPCPRSSDFTGEYFEVGLRFTPEEDRKPLNANWKLEIENCKSKG